MGPLLFLIYMNDFQIVPSYFFSILFANNTSIFLEGTEYSKVIKELNRELIRVSDWLKSNKLILNVKKTRYMVLHRSRIKLNRRVTIIIDSRNIELVQTFKFLGIILDSKLNFKNRLEYSRRSKISKSMGILYKTRSFLTKCALRNLYCSFVYPYLI